MNASWLPIDFLASADLVQAHAHFNMRYAHFIERFAMAGKPLACIKALRTALGVKAYFTVSTGAGLLHQRLH